MVQNLQETIVKTTAALFLEPRKLVGEAFVSFVESLPSGTLVLVGVRDEAKGRSDVNGVICQAGLLVQNGTLWSLLRETGQSSFVHISHVPWEPPGLF